MTPEARAARERKQKIFVLVGGLLLVAMLAFQLPKLLGGSSSESAAAADETTTLPGQPAVSSPATPVGLPGGTPVAVATTPKITSFSTFALKDPFVQQVAADSGIGAAASAGNAATPKTGAAETPAKEFTTGASTAAAVTIVTVNGARQVLAPGMKFPAADPLFVLVAENPTAKSVVVGIVGGAYSGGGSTTKLKVGKPITLVNTTTGAQYKIALVSVGSGDAAAQPAAPTP
jgi:hypothetical protein